MSKQFIKGNVYVFTKKRYLADACKYNSKSIAKLSLKIWGNRINGNEVTVDSNFSASVRGMFVCPDWCKCIKNNSPRIESKEIKDKTINLCDTCKFEIPSCKATEEGIDFKFGNGLGNDNVYECKIYELKSEGI